MKRHKKYSDRETAEDCVLDWIKHNILFYELPEIDTTTPLKHGGINEAICEAVITGVGGKLVTDLIDIVVDYAGFVFEEGGYQGRSSRVPRRVYLHIPLAREIGGVADRLDTVLSNWWSVALSRKLDHTICLNSHDDRSSFEELAELEVAREPSEGTHGPTVPQRWRHRDSQADLTPVIFQSPPRLSLFSWFSCIVTHPTILLHRKICLRYDRKNPSGLEYTRPEFPPLLRTGPLPESEDPDSYWRKDPLWYARRERVVPWVNIANQENPLSAWLCFSSRAHIATFARNLRLAFTHPGAMEGAEIFPDLYVRRIGQLRGVVMQERVVGLDASDTELCEPVVTGEFDCQEPVSHFG